MANRRMISQEVICCDDFLDMPFEAQALFFQLQIKADEYGFVQSPRNVLRMMGVKPEALTALIDSGFVIRFHSGVIVMTHWKRANTLKNDRANPIAFPDEFRQLREDEKRVYHLVESDGIQRNPMESQPNLTEPSINSAITEPSMNPAVTETTTTTDSTYTGTPAGGGAGGGDLPPEILSYARERARGANNPAAYEAAILERIRKAGFKTLEEVKAADEDRRKRPQTGPVYADEDDFY